ncbi:MAG: protein-glutamate methylesterase/protein-glutamine glutaminase [Treponemataceae bacterium]
MDEIKVLVVDDSVLMRNLISRIISKAEGMTVIGTAMNGKFALDKIPSLKPDIIILDIEMPQMNGIQFLEARRAQNIDIPVIILSSIAKEGAAVTMDCLALGASDFITKPSGSESPDLHVIAETLVEYISSYGRKYKQLKSLRGETESTTRTFGSEFGKLTGFGATTVPSPTPQKTEAPKNSVTPLRSGGKIEIIALGISTGGPNALREMFPHLDPNLAAPMLVVQHMPAGFTQEFAKSLNALCPLEVQEAKDGDVLKPGRVFIAPGNQHIYVEKRQLATVVRVNQDPTRSGHRPSADYLFDSVAKNFQNNALGVIMTGMGKDGAEMLAEMRRQGAYTLGQDEASAIVYGMPRVAYEYGAVQKQVPLANMAEEINKLVREHS